MIFRSYPSILIAFLLSFQASSITIPNIERVHETHPHDIDPGHSNSDPAKSIIDLNSKTKYDIGTKDAPVDGKDGKPHAGPWVGNEKDVNKAKPAHDPQIDDSMIQKEKENMEISQGKVIPETNDGVMDDPIRQLPKHGTTGTEGGVSEKDKARKAQEGQTGERMEKKPSSPKEAPPLPFDKSSESDSEKLKTKDTEDSERETKESLAGLEKPNNLPDRLSNLPHPLPGSARKDHLDIPKSDTKLSTKYDLLWNESDDRLIQPLHSYILSLAMILFTEVGDKTFLVAVLMAMKHDRLLVFSAAFLALLVMTVLSAILGHSVPTLISKRLTSFLAASLFLVFGGRMLNEGLEMSSGEGVGTEMKEVEMELEEKEHLAYRLSKERSSISPYNLEIGLGRSRTRRSRSKSRLSSPPRSPSSSPDRSPSPQRSSFKKMVRGLNNLFSLLLSPAWVQTFVMTFLGEWGDRSQIATIAMAAGQDYWWVTAGAVCGHAVCTGVAVLGGRAIAGKVSMRVGTCLSSFTFPYNPDLFIRKPPNQIKLAVTLGGAISFLLFGVIFMVEAYNT